MKKLAALLLGVVLALGSVGFFPAAAAEAYFADGYNGSTYEGYSYLTIDYTTKSDSEIFIFGGVPKYYDTTALLNTCANTAGAILLGYYDGDYNNLIPNFESKRVILGKVLFSAMASPVQEVINDLYTRMGTNVGGAGTTVQGFKEGMQSYVQSKGRNISFTSVVSNGNINTSAYKSAVNSETPMALFVSKYSMTAITDFGVDSDTDSMRVLHYGGNHVLIAYGIREIKYYDAYGAQFRELTLLQVATGYDEDPLVYVLIDDRIEFVDGYAVTIY